MGGELVGQVLSELNRPQAGLPATLRELQTCAVLGDQPELANSYVTSSVDNFKDDGDHHCDQAERADKVTPIIFRDR